MKIFTGQVHEQCLRLPQSLVLGYCLLFLKSHLVLMTSSSGEVHCDHLTKRGKLRSALQMVLLHNMPTLTRSGLLQQYCSNRVYVSRKGASFQWEKMEEVYLVIYSVGTKSRH